MRYSEHGRPRTIMDELEEAGEELEELSKLNAKEKGRERFSKSGVANWLNPNTELARRLQELDYHLARPDFEHHNDFGDDFQLTSPVEMEPYELPELAEGIRYVDMKRENFCPEPSNFRYTQTGGTQTSFDDLCPDSEGLNSNLHDPYKSYPYGDQHPEYSLKDRPESIPDSYSEYYSPPSTNFRNQTNQGGNNFITNDDEEMIYRRESPQPQLREVPHYGKQPPRTTKFLEDAYKLYGIRSQMLQTNNGHQKYRSVNMNTHTGRDRVFKSPVHFGPSPEEMVRESHCYSSSPRATTINMHSDSPSHVTRPQCSPSALTNILTGKDGKLMTGPRAVARVREHQLTSSKIYQNQNHHNDSGIPHRQQQRAQLAVQNLSPTSQPNNMPHGAHSFDSPPKSHAHERKTSSSRSNRSGPAGTQQHQLQPSSEIFTVGVIKRHPSVNSQKSSKTKTIENNSATPGGDWAIKKESVSRNNRKSAPIPPKVTASSRNCRKVASSSLIERRHSTGSNKSGLGSGTKSDGKKYKSPRAKKSNASSKDEHQTINFFENEKFNSLLMKMMTETTPDDNGGSSRKILTKKLKIPKSSNATL